MIRRVADPADFCFVGSEPQARLTSLERLTLTGGEDLEKAIAWLAKQFNAAGASQFTSQVSFDEVRDALSYYSRQGWIDKPATFFPELSDVPQVTTTPVHGLIDGMIEDLSFTSRASAHHPSVEGIRAITPENDRVHVRFWRHHEKPRATMISIHGWTMGDQRINSLAFLPGIFYRLGLDVALIELPYHGRRKPKHEVPFTPMTTADAIRQALTDLRDLGSYLKSLDRGDIGIMGMSLGGYLAALWSSLEPLAFCVPIVPLVSLAELEWEVLSRQPNFDDIQDQGLSLDHLRLLYSPHSPLSHQPKTPKERTMLIAGLGDSVVPARQPKMLWDHWKRPPIHWLIGGHVAQLKRTRAFEEVVALLRGLGYVSS